MKDLFSEYSGGSCLYVECNDGDCGHVIIRRNRERLVLVRQGGIIAHIDASGEIKEMLGPWAEYSSLKRESSVRRVIANLTSPPSPEIRPADITASERRFLAITVDSNGYLHLGSGALTTLDDATKTGSALIEKVSDVPCVHVAKMVRTISRETKAVVGEFDTSKD